MAAVQIQVDQPGAGIPVGTPGQAREDMKLGFPALLSAFGGPYLGYQWTIIDKAVDIVAGIQSAAALSAPSASISNMLPIDLPGTYLVQLVVDSGSGLGATEDDIASITFYAGPTLNPDPAGLPRRIPAFKERGEHNVPDVIFPGGNERGWAEEWERWFAFLTRLAGGLAHSWGAVTVPVGGPAALASGLNAGVAWVSTGVVDVTFTTPALNANYAVVYGADGGVGGDCATSNKTVNGFRVSRGDAFGALVDADFGFMVMVAP